MKSHKDTLATGRAFESMARDFHAKGDTKRAEQYQRFARETFERAGHHGHNSTPPPERGSHSHGQDPEMPHGSVERNDRLMDSTDDRRRDSYAPGSKRRM